MERGISTMVLMLALAGALPGAEESLPQKKGLVTDRPNLGVQLLSIRPGEEREGIRVNYVYPGSAAREMGLRPGDEILALNGIEVQGRSQFIRELQRNDIGGKIEIRIRRGGEVLPVQGAMGNFLKTRKAFLEHCEKEVLGKPFATVCEIVWPDGTDGLQALKGKVGLIICIDGCRDCVEGTWKKFLSRWEELQKLRQTWIGFCGIYSNLEETYQKNLLARNSVLGRAPAKFPFGVARYPDDKLPPDSLGKEPLIQDHGIALLDPEGKVLYLQLSGFEPENPTRELGQALEKAARKFAPKPEAKQEKPSEKKG